MKSTWARVLLFLLLAQLLLVWSLLDHLPAILTYGWVAVSVPAIWRVAVYIMWPGDDDEEEKRK